jgi:hypothetical protein
LGGAAVLALVVGAGVVMAQTPSSTPSTSPSIPGKTVVPGTAGSQPQSNEDATHEAGEDPTREAAEDSGQGFGGKHGGRRDGTRKPNEDTTHEAGESPEREATEDAGASATPAPGN